MPVAGFVKRRRHQFGRQSAHGTSVAAKRAYAFKGVPSVDPQWTDPDVDTGSIDPVVAPYREAGDYSASLTTPLLRYNDLPLILSGFFGGGVTPSGTTAKTWLYTPASVTVDPVDEFTYEFGDDVVTDWDQLSDGILLNFEIAGPEGKGPCTASMSWAFGRAAGSGFTDYPDSPTVPTALSVAPNEAIVYGKDVALYLASDPYDLGYSSSKILNALHTWTLRGTVEVDRKGWADGDQTFDIDAWAITARSLELKATFAKTADIVGLGSESDQWFSDTAVDRFVRLYAESTVDADTGVPNSWDTSLPMRYYTREESEVGGNTVVILTGHGFYDDQHPSVGAFTSEVVNTLADASF